MKKVLSQKTTFLFLLLFSGTVSAQTIDFDYQIPGPSFQDADVGSIALADVDGDGDLDFLASGKGGPIKTTLYLNDGNGNFTEDTSNNLENMFGGTVKFADIDGDQDMDLLITGQNQVSIVKSNLYINDGNGGFTLAQNTPFVSSNGGEFAFGDINGDTHLDLIMAGYDSNGNASTELFTNDGNGNFTLVANTPFTQVLSSSVSFIDANNNNINDILLAGNDDNGVPVTELYTNDGSGNFTLVANTPFPPISSGDLEVGDIDNDGDDDVMLMGSNANGNVTELYINDGTGNFSIAPNTSFPGTNIGGVRFADFNNNGNKDILLFGSSNSVIALVYENLTNNQFILADSLNGAYLSSAAIGDIDGDMKQDIIIAGTSFTAPSRSTKTYLNVSTVSSTEPVTTQHIPFSVYPNPSNGAFTIEPENGNEYSVQLYDNLGRLIYESSNHINNQQLNIATTPGLYNLIIIQADKTYNKTLLISN